MVVLQSGLPSSTEELQPPEIQMTTFFGQIARKVVFLFERGCNSSVGTGSRCNGGIADSGAQNDHFFEKWPFCGPELAILPSSTEDLQSAELQNDHFLWSFGSKVAVILL